MVELSADIQKKFKEVFKQELFRYRKDIFRCTQEEAATKLNISLQYYKDLEHGIVIPSTKMLINLTEKFGFRVDYLFRYLLNDASCDKKSQEQVLLEQINNTCSDSVRRALIYHWNMYMNPKNRSGFSIVEESLSSSEGNTPYKQKSRKSQAD